MQISIIGAGRIGSTLALQLGQAGHSVSIANSRGPASLGDVERDTGAKAMSLQEVGRGASAVILALPFPAVASLPKEVLGDAARDLVIIDASNYVPGLRDQAIQSIEDGQIESSWIAEQLGRPVVKAFNTITAASLKSHLASRPEPNRIVLPVAGEAEGKNLVRALAADLQFDFLDAGGIQDSWRQQPGTPIYCTDLNAMEAGAALALADPLQTIRWRDEKRGGER
ncbi:NADPH-dependent F420 reductase [Arthrobacter sp. NA-172]|uniref:NADPH-dependent F420 reductase n=1 Tax=Arthrobacter sp. NA-172 TaxID=3367524 RepID=UPI003754964F